MYKKGKQQTLDPPKKTIVWSCLSNLCNGWKREDFTFESIPTCPFCHGEMEKETRMLPQINHEFTFHKNKKHS